MLKIIAFAIVAVGLTLCGIIIWVNHSLDQMDDIDWDQ